MADAFSQSKVLNDFASELRRHRRRDFWISTLGVLVALTAISGVAYYAFAEVRSADARVGAQYQAQIAENTKQIADYKTELKAASESVASVTEEKMSLSKQLDAAVTEREAANAEVKELKAEIENRPQPDLDPQLALLQNELKRTRDEREVVVARLVNEKSVLKNAQDVAESRNKQLTARIDQAASEAEAISRKLADTESRLMAAEARVRELGARAPDEERSSFDKKIEQLRVDLAQAVEENGVLQQRIAKQQCPVPPDPRASREFQQLRRQFEAQRGRISELEIAANSASNQARELEAANVNLADAERRVLGCQTERTGLVEQSSLWEQKANSCADAIPRKDFDVVVNDLNTCAAVRDGLYNEIKSLGDSASCSNMVPLANFEELKNEFDSVRAKLGDAQKNCVK